jgi:hypothetical protein
MKIIVFKDEMRMFAVLSGVGTLGWWWLKVEFGTRKRRQTPKQRAFVPSPRPLYDAQLHALTAYLRRLRFSVSMGFA